MRNTQRMNNTIKIYEQMQQEKEAQTQPDQAIEIQPKLEAEGGHTASLSFKKFVE